MTSAERGEPQTDPQEIEDAEVGWLVKRAMSDGAAEVVVHRVELPGVVAGAPPALAWAARPVLRPSYQRSRRGRPLLAQDPAEIYDSAVAMLEAFPNGFGRPTDANVAEYLRKTRGTSAPTVRTIQEWRRRGLIGGGRSGRPAKP